MKLTPEGRDKWYTSPLYEVGIAAYECGVRIASLRNKKCSKMLAGHKATWRTLEKNIEPGAKYVWIHTASLGEFEQGRPLIERIKKSRPDLKVILTFFSPSGYEVRKNYTEADIVCYLPFDRKRNARRFVEMVNPVAAVFVKYEFWRNYLLELRKSGAKVYLISAIFRPSQLFFRRRGKWYRRLLHCFDTLYVQEDASQKLLEEAGVKNVVVAGDTRFDRVTDIMASRRDLPVIEAFARNHTVLVAGSSWPSDEEIYFPWLESNPDVRAVIAPHEFDSGRVRRLLERFPGQTATWSDVKTNPSAAEGKRILILDCFGLLSSAYRYASVAYVGGGFGAGLHNVNEAAVYSVPVIFGPNNAKFAEAAGLRNAGGGFEVRSKEDFAKVSTRLFSDSTFRQEAGDAAGSYIRSKLGATDIIFNKLFGQEAQI